VLKKILNLGILAHVDAGKTSLTERLLFDNGAISQLGSVDAGSTQTDTSELERERGITIRSAVASFDTDDLQVNLVDTPGHPDFIAEVERALSVLDGAVLVLSAVEGVQAQTRVLLKSLRKLRLPTLIFINKIDRLGARTDDLLADIRRKLAAAIIPMNSVQDAGTSGARVVMRSLDEQDFRTQAAEILADNDDVLLTQLVDGSPPSPADLQTLLVRQTAAGLLHPVFFGSAMTGEGARELADGIRALLSPRGGPAAGNGGVRGTVFAIERVGNGEKVAYLRLFSGELRERQRVTFRRRESSGAVSEFTGRVTRLEVISPRPYGSDANGQSAPGRGRSGSDRRRVTAGSIAKLRGFPQIRVGDQIGELDGSAEQLHFSPPSLESVIRPRQPGQETRLHAALTSLADEDPLIRTRVAGSGATSVLLYGAVQKEVIAARLQRDFGVAALFEQTQPVYFERPVGVGTAKTEMDRRGPNDFWATVGLRVEPTTLGTGISFTREVEWGALPRAFHRAIEEATYRALEQGLYGWEVTDCLVTVTDVAYDAPITVAADFRNLTPIVLMRALQAAGIRVYEPCHSFEVEVPSDVLSNVIGNLTSLGADIAQSTDSGNVWLVTGEIPARQVQEFAAALPGLSHGEGVLWSHPGTDRPVRGTLPTRERSDGNPLNYDEYMRFLANRSLGSTAAAGPRSPDR
jgi:ribosomal protection tetracycline resistance protein